MEKEEQKGYRAHCLALCYPSQGHINPILQFSKRLEHKGVKVTLVTTLFISKTIQRASSSSISLETISDGYDEGGIVQAGSTQAYLDRFRVVGQQTLIELVEKFNGSGCHVDCIIYDSFVPWALDVAKKFGIVGASFFTQSCAVNSIYYLLHKGLMKAPLTESEILIPALPPFQPQDMPSFLYDFGSNPAALDMLVDQFSNVNEVDWILCNSFYELEKEVADWQAMLWPLRTVGPTIPSIYLDKRLEEDKDYGFSLFKPNNDACMKWLNDRSKGSVVYVSFGSLVEVRMEQMEEVASGLKASDSYFLWVVRESEQGKLPKDFVAETSQKGLVVSWCAQLDVLAHEAVGCFLTHCGWNSTVEALSLGVPMVGVPLWSDQSTNAKCIQDVWKTGLRAPVDEKGIARRDAVAHCIREIMESETGKEIRRNANKLSKLAKEAADEGGSSDRNIIEFVAKLSQS